ncbi:DUF1684 domain-containing protein [Luteimonas sp. BDR2-5]|uniref:DUF1684 domain-containing protein n=1 Tax=Proluteimonas luteida TaxID=2878685 RepID=UPI001E4E730E|nr:DUF1684 domain-containing protein [Luteimonas sp. BDR2-5]MCD9029963.1 DUF1684 domain-containing protein [Luteimonas sp. BDR2-5]
MSRMRLILPALAAALLFTGCAGGDASADPATAAETARLDQAFVDETRSWQRQREERLTAPDGWTSLIGLHWLELKAHYVGSDATSGLRIAMGPGKLGLLQQQGDALFFTPERGAALTLDGAPLRGRARVRTDRDETPGTIGFDDGKGQLSVIERGNRKALRVRHADAPTRTGFAGLDYWPIDRDWRIDARFTPAAPGTTIEIADIIGTINRMPCPGAVTFERDGASYTLQAVEGEAGGLFLILADRTSGHGSYGAGRYLDTAAPDADGHVVLDFNRAYNPPCAFTPFATCPLPPQENRLDLAITAGEKAYAKPVL